MFSNAKVGDRVYFIQCGWGTIIQIFKNKEYPIIYKSDKGMIYNFRIDGKRDILDVNQSLFWNEIKFEIPEKSFDLKEELKKLEVVKFENKKLNYFLYYDNDNNSIRSGYNVCEDAPFFIFFSSESICKFLNKIENKKITKEQFFTAYKNVFGGINAD